MKALRLLFPILFVGMVACDSSSRPSGEDVLAMAAGFEFSSEAAAEILAPQLQLPGQPEVVEALADLWVQYYLLARAAAEDSTLSNIDVGPLVTRQLEGEMVAQLRDRVIQVDTMIPDDVLLARFEAELPGAGSEPVTFSFSSLTGLRMPRWTVFGHWRPTSDRGSLEVRISPLSPVNTARMPEPLPPGVTWGPSGGTRWFLPSKPQLSLSK